MRAGGRETGSSHEDVLLSRVYQQVTEQQSRRFGADYDLEKGLERYRAWLHEHAETRRRGTRRRRGIRRQ